MKISAKFVPWLLLLLALPVALYGLVVSSPTACSQLPGAFGDGVTTRQSNVVGGLVADKCETTRINDGSRTEVTVVNWSGLVAAFALCIGAWIAGAALVGRLNRRTSAAVLSTCTAVFLGAVVAFFL